MSKLSHENAVHTCMNCFGNPNRFKGISLRQLCRLQPSDLVPAYLCKCGHCFRHGGLNTPMRVHVWLATAKDLSDQPGLFSRKAGWTLSSPAVRDRIPVTKL